MPAARLREYLQEQQVDYDVHEHVKAYPAQEVAAAEHVSGWALAKPVMLSADGQLVMAVLPAAMRIDLDRAQATLQVDDVRLADETEFTDRFPDCERGAEPPFGNLYDVPVYVDETLLDQPSILFRDGTHTHTLKMGLQDYLRLVEPERVRIAVPENG